MFMYDYDGYYYWYWQSLYFALQHWSWGEQKIFIYFQIFACTSAIIKWTGGLINGLLSTFHLTIIRSNYFDIFNIYSVTVGILTRFWVHPHSQWNIKELDFNHHKPMQFGHWNRSRNKHVDIFQRSYLNFKRKMFSC